MKKEREKKTKHGAIKKDERGAHRRGLVVASVGAAVATTVRAVRRARVRFSAATPRFTEEETTDDDILGVEWRYVRMYPARRRGR